MVMALRAMLQARAEDIGEHLTDRRRGQGFVEYAFILLFIGVALTAALLALQGGISGLFGTVSSCLGGDGTTAC
jgi:Flp pilus assembly pilin Flp